MVLVVMLYLSVRGVKPMTSADKRHSLEKTLEDIKHRLNITKETEPEINPKIPPINIENTVGIFI